MEIALLFNRNERSVCYGKHETSTARNVLLGDKCKFLVSLYKNIRPQNSMIAQTGQSSYSGESFSLELFHTSRPNLAYKTAK